MKSELVEAKYYTKEKDKLKCNICPNYCIIGEGKVGRCLGRKNISGKLYAINYGEVVSMAMDPIEKKPLYHFYPGSKILSVATYGCNLLCPFCQNWEISHQTVPSRYIEPKSLLEIAKRPDSIGISYTYTEPLIWFEYLMDICPLAKKAGLKNVLVTNGMVNEAPLRELLPYIDAMNIDLKSIKPEFYDDFIKGDLPTVLNTIRISKPACHIELTNLLIPTKNDSIEELTELVDFVASVGKDTVLHFSRYFPNYKLDIAPTPTETLIKAYEIAKKKLDYVYIGNVTGLTEGNNTHCPKCSNLLVAREYFTAKIKGIKDGACNQCRRKVDIVMNNNQQPKTNN
jgi:pyruvate formate lyase activating enzyme